MKNQLKTIVILFTALGLSVGCKSVFTDYKNLTGGAFDAANQGQQTGAPMIFKIQTSQNNEAYRLPIPDGFEYDFRVDWGDESPNGKVTAFDDAEAVHTFKDQGVYTIKLYGKVQAFRQSASAGPCIITEVEDLGSVGWRSLLAAFMDCPNLVSVKGGDLSKVRSTRGMFYRSAKAEPQTADWDVSQVRNMEGMFAFARNANPDTSKWDVSKVRNFSAMFMGTEKANPETGSWVTKSARNMSWMFHQAQAADPDVSEWDLSNVIDIQSIFNEAPLANPDVSEWDVSKVTNLSGVFRLAISAQPDVRNWEVAQVTTMESLFGGARLAKPDMSLWDFSNVVDMDNLVNLTSITSENYSNLLIRVNETTAQTGVLLRAGRVKYSAAAKPARDELTQTKGWTIYDAGAL